MKWANFSLFYRFFVKSTLQKYKKHALKHIFLSKYLVGLKKSSTFAPCFSWY